MPFIHTIPEAEATGELAALYQRLAYADGSVDEAFRALSLNPALLAADAAMYDTVMYGDSPLSRLDRELLAMTVSRLNGCERCLRHHSARCASLGGRVEPGRAQAMLAFAEKLTRDPGATTAADIDALRRAGLEDRAILDTCNVVAYFAYANRMTLGLGLSRTPEPPRPRPGREG